MHTTNYCACTVTDGVENAESASERVERAAAGEDGGAEAVREGRQQPTQRIVRVRIVRLSGADIKYVMSFCFIFVIIK